MYVIIKEVKVMKNLRAKILKVFVFFSKLRVRTFNEPESIL